MLPYSPQPLDQLKARYSKAIDRTFDVELIKFSAGKRPGELRDCVFDFEEGLRLIVSKDLHESEVLYHFSASAFGKLLDEIRSTRVTQDAFCDLAVKRFWDIAGKHVVRLVGYSERGIPHFKVEAGAA